MTISPILDGGPPTVRYTVHFMQLAPLLRAHAHVRIEQPPVLWEAEAQDVALARLLGEMIAAALARGTPLSEVVLNVANFPRRR